MLHFYNISNYKSDLENFDTTINRITFLPDEGSAINEQVAHILLVYNEATEQVFNL